ncbi:hypothetical protein [Enterococcus wangshanyuanii]|uniref:Phage protein n=1 Tax=Enterococcus wangshanyuanii TaxID=2005703 RepID=A0ABQ1NYM6_9ENTE|nr:hypothetical protein [Enterococcus wangshanyuanii]GGC87748.1 hypothetical protein GCM10011573_16700 [Enterococcus wangshanyuanii]
MESWITPTVVATVITAVFTYMGTKRTSRSEIDQIYLPRVENMIQGFEKQIDHLTKKVSELEKKLNTKDELITELRKENSRLEEENKKIKSENKELKGRVNNGIH